MSGWIYAATGLYGDILNAKLQRSEIIVSSLERIPFRELLYTVIHAFSNNTVSRKPYRENCLFSTIWSISVRNQTGPAITFFDGGFLIQVKRYTLEFSRIALDWSHQNLNKLSRLSESLIFNFFYTFSRTIQKPLINFKIRLMYKEAFQENIKIAIGLIYKIMFMEFSS